MIRLIFDSLTPLRRANSCCDMCASIIAHITANLAISSGSGFLLAWRANSFDPRNTCLGTSHSRTTGFQLTNI